MRIQNNGRPHLSMWPLPLSLVAIAVFFIFLITPLPLRAQPQITPDQVANLPLVDPAQIPTYGTFWEWYYGRNGQALTAPLPQNPFGPEVPVYALGNGQYLINNGPDDLNRFQQQQLETRMNLASPMVGSDPSIGQTDDTTQLTPNFPPGTFYICSISVTGQVINLVLTNTFQNITYKIESKDALTNTADWLSEGTFPGLDGSTPVTLWIGNRTNQLLVRARSSIASSVSGIPDWWMMKYFGSDQTVWPDAYADINGDGNAVIEAYRNGWDPTTSHPSPPPQNLTAIADATGTGITLTWSSGGGPVTNYVIESGDDYCTTCLVPLGQVGPTTFHYIDHPTYPVLGSPAPTAVYRVRAQFSRGPDAISASAAPYRAELSPLSFQAVRGPSGQIYLAVSGLPQSVSALHAFPEYGSDQPEFTIYATNIVNGLVPLSTDQLVPYYLGGHFWVEPLTADGIFGRKQAVVFRDTGFSWQEEVGSTPRTNAWVNAAIHMKENLNFLLRAATVNYPFAYKTHLPTDSPEYGYILGDPNAPENNFSRPPSPTSYEYYGFRTFSSNLNYSVLQEARPIYENFLWRNFLFDPSGFGWEGAYGASDLYEGAYRTLTGFDYQYTGSGTEANPQHLLANTDWILFRDNYNFWIDGYGSGVDTEGNAELGLDFDANTNLVLGTPPVINCYGLPLQDMQIAYYGELVPGGKLTGDAISYGPFFPRFISPTLTTIDYYFVSQTPFLNAKFSGNDLPRPPIPGSPDFTVNTPSPLLIAPFGQSFSVSGWAKQAVAGSTPTKYAYLEQYFDAALTIDAKGNATSSSAGSLSPYGEFFPTMPGPAALVTMADIDYPNQRGTGIVNVIKLQLDVNHDGTMDLSFGGPDNTSAWTPYVFWVNNDCDWSSYAGDPGSDLAVDPENPNYFWDCRQPNPRSIRDLEDYARLWICGVPALTNGDYQVTLGWTSVSSGNPSINILQAFETNGGTLYLTDTNILSFSSVSWRQIGYGSVYGQVDYGRKYHVTTATNLTLPISWFTNGGNKYFLFEGASIGSGQLTLTISQNGQIVAQTDAWLDLHDVSDFYEQACATNVTSGKPPSSLVSDFKIIRTVNAPAPGETKQVIVFIHGINNTAEDYEETTRTIFKRLYWSGYHGRFASFRWPCAYLPWNTANPFQYNLGEFYAFKSATGLKTYLSYLKNNRPELAGYAIDLYAHSQGNVVTSEAVLQGAPFDNYILTQGAFPAHCYDTNVPFLQKLLDAEANTATPFYPANGGYHGYCASIQGNLVDFYNTTDFALATGTTLGLQTNWEEDQRAQKPEAFLGGPSYIYDPNTLYTTAYYTLVNSYNVTDLQEIKALVARSRSKAVGAQGGLHGAISGSVDLFGTYGFGNTRPEHSAQFARPIQTCLPYYRQVLTSFQILP